MDQNVARFIEHARQRGMDHATIRMLLLSTGWKDKEIARALTESSLEMPVPSPPDVGGAREAFMHLVMFAALYTVVTAVIVILFNCIDLLLPDMAETDVVGARWRDEIARSTIRWSIAAIVVGFPSLMLLSSTLLADIRRSPEKARSAIRRWLTYLTLFVAAITGGLDLITLLFRVLGGELTARFLLKVAILFVISGTGFLYYYRTIKAESEGKGASVPHRRYAIAAVATCVVAIAWGLVSAGSPSAARAQKLDAQRLMDMRTAYGEIERIALGDGWRDPAIAPEMKQPLPESLKAVAGLAVQRRPRIFDPATGAPYVYEVTDKTHFKLCATFSLPRDEPSDVMWNHPAGPHCFAFDALNPVR